MSKDIEKRLKEFHNKLPTDLQSEFRRILDDFASYYFEVGEIFKQTCIDLIPGKLAHQTLNLETSVKKELIKDDIYKMPFKPETKQTGLLAELQHNIDMMSTQERLNLITKLQSNSSQPETPTQVDEKKGL